MKQIYTLLTAGLILAGTALWSGCGNNELLDNGNPGIEASREAESLNFSLKGLGAKTRAVESLEKELETKVNTMYVALFLENNAAVGESSLHKIFCCDANAASGWEDLQITEADGTYTITDPGKIGNYIVYFIANPDKVIKDDLLAMQKNPDRTLLNNFEATLYTGANTADGATDDEGAAQTEAGSQRGFIMLAKEAITLSDKTSVNVSLTRLASRFDFINSAATSGSSEVKITKIEITKSGQKSIVAATATPTETTSLATLTHDFSASGWTDQTQYFTTYAYENLITEDEFDRSQIVVYYTLGAVDNTENKKLVIDLKEGDAYMGVTRNHLYRIYLNGVSGEYQLTVDDWTEGTTVTIPNKDLNIKYTATDLCKIGDYACVSADGNLYFVDGGLRELTLSGGLNWEAGFTPTLTEQEKAECVGILFSNKVSSNDENEGFKGYIVGLKDYGSSNLLASDNDAAKVAEYTGQSAIANLGAAYNDLDGYTHSNEIIRILGSNLETESKMLYDIQQGTDLPVLPQGKTSGWYVPSSGQMFQILVNLGNAGLKGYSSSTSTQFIDHRTTWGGQGAIMNVFNPRISAIGASVVSPISESTAWQSSTRANKRMIYFTFLHGGDLYGINSNYGCSGTRPVFAFK